MTFQWNIARNSLAEHLQKFALYVLAWSHLKFEIGKVESMSAFAALQPRS